MAMAILMRLALTVISMLGTFFFTFWLTGALLNGLPAGLFLAFIVAVGAAVF